MTATFKYILDDFKAYSTEQAQNIVKSVRFSIVCEHLGRKLDSFRTIEFADPDFNSFTEFKDLTQDQVLSWVVAEIGQAEVDELKFGLQSVIEQDHARANASPVIETVKAPWL